MEFLIDFFAGMSPRWMIIGFALGAVLSWFARGDWEGIGGKLDEEDNFAACPYRRDCAAHKEDA